MIEAGQALLPTWQAKDAVYLLQHLQRRIDLVQSGDLTLDDLD
jgi:hypothetical protein